MRSHFPARGKLVIRGEITRIPAAEAQPIPAAPKKSGVEILREDFQRNAESAPVKLVRIVDHDQGGRTLFSGSEEDYKALKKAKPARAKKATRKKGG